MIEITLQNISYGFFENPDSLGGRTIGFRDEQSGFVFNVPFNEESWKTFLAGANGRDIITPASIEDIKAAAMQAVRGAVKE